MDGRQAIPLASLRPDLEQGWHWSVRWRPNGDGAWADLEQPAGIEVGFRLSGLEGALLRATVTVPESDATLELRRAQVSLRLPTGQARTLWKGGLGRAGGRVVRRRLELSLESAEATEGDLVLAADGPVVWLAPGLELPAASGWAADPRSGTAPAAPVSHPSGTPRDRPLISVLMPVHDPPPPILEEAIDSVRGQGFAGWELCMVDDGSRDPRVDEILRDAAAADERVRLVRREEAGGISAATNSALEIARGEYVALLDHDDTLLPDALETVSAAIERQPDLDWVYSDEEVVEDGVSIHAFRKPAWSPDLLRTQMYVCHLGVYRRSLALEVGGFRSDFDGSQDYDFALRFSERTDRVAHIPRILYRWRAHSGSVAGNPHSKPGAYPAARRAIAEHLVRTGGKGDTHFGPWPGVYRVVHHLDSGLRVGVCVSARRDEPELERLLANLEDPGAAGLVAARVEVVTPGCWECAAAEGLDMVVFVDGVAIPVTHGWLARLAGFAGQPGVGAAGAKLVSATGLVEHAGFAFAGGVPVPLMTGSAAGESGPLGMSILPSNVSAVGGVLAAPAQLLHDLGGLDRHLGPLALPDFCLRAREQGLRSVLVGDSVLRRPHGTVAENDLPHLAAFQARWAGIANDPYFDLSRGWPGAEVG